jgi:tRNA threonylcarbamoyladenosine biosynthesis protein TsaB
MALILNIETATTVCSVALAKDGELICLKEINNGYTHAENLTVFIEELVKEANIKFADLDAIAVSKGPGSYTGLRIGVSTAKGLCYALGKPLVAVQTLKSIIFQYKSSKFKVQSSKSNVETSLNPLFCPMLDARRMEVYCALYDVELSEISPVEAKVIDENSFEEYLKKTSIYFFGDGAAKCREKIGSNANAVFIDNVVPSAAAMISFSEAAFNTGEFEDVAYFEPYYLKDFVAGPKKKS